MDPPGIDQVLKDFSTQHIPESQLSKMLAEDRKQFVVSLAERAFSLDLILKNLYFHRKSFNKDENRSIKQQYLPWTNELIDSTRAIHEVGLKFIVQVKTMTGQEGYLHALSERVEKAWEYFEKELNRLTGKISDHLALLKKEKRVTEYGKELKELESRYHLQLNDMFKLRLFIRSASENKILTKNDLHHSERYQSSPSTEKKKAKKEKTPTSEISFNLFKEGKTIDEIAKERGFVRSTIEGHLCRYVESGEIDVLKVLEKEKLERILKRYEKGIEGLGELKSDLGDEISYGEIKLALAHDKFLKQKEEKEG